VTPGPDAAAVARLLAAQVPALAGLPVAPFGPGGTENALWRIGEGAVARFPRTAAAAGRTRREIAWLPRLPALPLDAPSLIAAGRPGEGWDRPWAVLTLLPGADALAAPPAALTPALAALIGVLRAAPVPRGLPRAGPGRLGPASLALARRMAARFRPDEGDPDRLLGLISAAARLPAHAGPPVWSHGDLHPLNLLVRGGSLSAVIDWGTLAAADPARDLICAWTLCDAPGRAALHAALCPDPAEWRRARAAALVMAVQAIPFHRKANPRFAAAMRRTLAEALAEMPADPAGAPG
jgi:aminoglycoside phosphotransferase (APT) family kinase protein